MKDCGAVILEISRGSRLKWKRITVFSTIVLFLLLLLLASYNNSPVAFSLLIPILFFSYIVIKEWVLDRTRPICTIYEDGIKSELLKPCGSDYIPWDDIKNIELVNRFEAYYRAHCEYLLIAPRNEIKYKSGRGETFVTGENEYGFNTLSINITFGLNIEPSDFYSVCENAHKNAIS